MGDQPIELFGLSNCFAPFFATSALLVANQAVLLAVHDTDPNAKDALFPFPMYPVL